MAEALADDVVVDSSTVRRYHERMRLESDRMAQMVDDLFELSRIHAGALRLSRQQVALSDLVSDTLASTDPIARAKGVHLHGHADASPLVTVDVEQMSRVFRNLVVNAIRHTPSDGAIDVTCGVDRSGAPIVAVADACGGISADDLARVFEVGFRGEAARSPNDASGAGLGLAIAQGIVDAHDGGIDAANAGDGCRFVVRLPGTAVVAQPARA